MLVKYKKKEPILYMNGYLDTNSDGELEQIEDSIELHKNDTTNVFFDRKKKLYHLENEITITRKEFNTLFKRVKQPIKHKNDIKTYKHKQKLKKDGYRYYNELLYDTEMTEKYIYNCFVKVIGKGDAQEEFGCHGTFYKYSVKKIEHNKIINLGEKVYIDELPF